MAIWSWPCIQDYTRPRNAHLKIFNTISAYLCSCSCQYCYHIKQKYCIFFSRRSPDPLVPSQFPPFGVSFQWTHPKIFLCIRRCVSLATKHSILIWTLTHKRSGTILYCTRDTLRCQKFSLFFNTLNCRADTTKSYTYLPVTTCDKVKLVFLNDAANMTQ